MAARREITDQFWRNKEITFLAAGWSSSYKLLQTQLQRKKVAQTRPLPTSVSCSNANNQTL